jgi:3-oxoacyl-[acyl-carrier protein] reductase
MSDVLLKVGESGSARRLLKTMGLPLSLPAPLQRAEGPWEALPLQGRRIVVATAASPGDSAALTDTLERSVVEAGAEVSRAAGFRPDALLFDATAIASPAELRSLYDFFQPLVAELAQSGRVVVVARPVAAAISASAAAAQAALEGFVRSLAKELGKKGATVQLLRVAPGAESGLAPLLRFLLSPRSAFITGQVLALDAAATPRVELPWVRPLRGKVALVTGAARGIGQATAERLAQEGAHVLCVDRPDAAQATEQVARALKGSSLACDLGQSDTAQLIADELGSKHGGVDIVVHNAGVTRDKTLGRMTPEQWDEVVDVNLGAVLRIDKALQGLLRAGGRSIYVASIAGIAGTVGQTNYAAAKAGLLGYVRYRAARVSPVATTVNAVAPGLIETRLTAAMPLFVREAGRRLSALAQGGQPGDVAEAITFLASPGAAALHGCVLRVCGGAFLGA